MADRVVLSVGTKRGLFLVESNKRRARWTIRGPFFEGWTINHAIVDTRGAPRVHAAASNYTFGTTTASMDLQGKRVKTAELPPKPPAPTPKHKKQAAAWGVDMSPRVWAIQPGPERQKKVLYAGTAPAGLFRSEDSGKTWQPLDGFNQHKTRKHWQPGAGGMSLHSLQLDPHDPQKMYVGVSAAGAFRSEDSGATWHPINQAVADYVGAPKESLVGT